MAEFLIILPVALLLILGAIQFALIYHAKTTLNYAAFEAGRYGSLNNAQFASIKEGFTRGLAPLYSYYEPDEAKRKARSGKKAANQVEAFQVARDSIFNEFDDPRELIQIERLSPTETDFADFAIDSDIPNDNLIYRASQLGQRSRHSIQDANRLHLRITYWYPLYVPLVNKVIYGVICNDTEWSGEKACVSPGDGPEDPRIPLTVVTVMRMQSPARKSSGFKVR